MSDFVPLSDRLYAGEIYLLSKRYCMHALKKSYPDAKRSPVYLCVLCSSYWPLYDPTKTVSS